MIEKIKHVKINLFAWVWGGETFEVAEHIQTSEVFILGNNHFTRIYLN